MVTQRWPLIVQQEKLLKLAVSDYIDRTVDGRSDASAPYHATKTHMRH
jgi:hypothetical protein